MWDIAVVGAGPAGSTAALRLARIGARVVLVDRHPFPRDKSCGDALLPDAVRSLTRSGLWGRVEAAAFRAEGAQLLSPSGIEVPVNAPFTTIPRRTFDNLLVEAAVEAGAARRTGHVARIEQPSGGAPVVHFHNAQPPISARVVVVATGADVSLLRPLGMVRDTAPSAVAVRCYLRSSQLLDRLVFSFDRASLPGYGWIFPLGGGLYNVGVGLFGKRSGGANPRRLFERFMAESPLARRMAAAGGLEGRLQGARLRCGLVGTKPVRGNVVAVGECLGTTYPFSGEGIGKAMESAELACDVIEEVLRDPRARAEEVNPAFPEPLRSRYSGYRIAERWFGHSWVADLLASRARRSAFMRDTIARVVHETDDPRTIFSVRGLLRSLTG